MLLCVSLTRLVISLLAIGETGKNAICGLPPHYALSLKLIFIYIINIFRHVVSCLCISLPRWCCSVRLSFKNALKCRCRRCCRCWKTGLQSSWSMTIIVIVKFMLIQNVCMFSYVPICIDFNIEFTTYGHQMTVNIVHGENEVNEEKNVQRKKRQRQAAAAPRTKNSQSTSSSSALALDSWFDSRMRWSACYDSGFKVCICAWRKNFQQVFLDHINFIINFLSLFGSCSRPHSVRFHSISF